MSGEKKMVPVMIILFLLGPGLIYYTVYCNDGDKNLYKNIKISNVYFWK